MDHVFVVLVEEILGRNLDVVHVGEQANVQTVAELVRFLIMPVNLRHRHVKSNRGNDVPKYFLFHRFGARPNKSLDASGGSVFRN
jgi:hypothetical protein